VVLWPSAWLFQSGIPADSNSRPTVFNGSKRQLIGGPLNVKLMEQQFDEVMRLTASIKQGTVTASLILRKLAAYPRQNGVLPSPGRDPGSLL
jgi:hypothetical protein